MTKTTPRGLTVSALILGIAAGIATCAAMWDNMYDRSELSGLAVWKRPLAFGVNEVPLNILIFAALLLLVARLTATGDRAFRVAAVVTVAAGAMQTVPGLGYWIVVFTVSDAEHRRFAFSDGKVTIGDLIYRVPELAVAVVVVTIASSLLRTPQPPQAQLTSD